MPAETAETRVPAAGVAVARAVDRMGQEAMALLAAQPWAVPVPPEAPARALAATAEMPQQTALPVDRLPVAVAAVAPGAVAAPTTAAVCG
jgi:hypothetical protein